MGGHVYLYSCLQVSFENDIPKLEYEPNLDDILNDVRESWLPPPTLYSSLLLPTTATYIQEIFSPPSPPQDGKSLLTVDELGLNDVLQDTEEQELSLPYAFKDGFPKLVVLYTVCQVEGKECLIHELGEHTSFWTVVLCVYSSSWLSMGITTHVIPVD